MDVCELWPENETIVETSREQETETQTLQETNMRLLRLLTVQREEDPSMLQRTRRCLLWSGFWKEKNRARPGRGGIKSARMQWHQPRKRQPSTSRKRWSHMGEETERNGNLCPPEWDPTSTWPRITPKSGTGEITRPRFGIRRFS